MSLMDRSKVEIAAAYRTEQAHSGILAREIATLKDAMGDFLKLAEEVGYHLYGKEDFSKCREMARAALKKAQSK